jgi:hypothetical protein
MDGGQWWLALKACGAPVMRVERGEKQKRRGEDGAVALFWWSGGGAGSELVAGAMQHNGDSQRRRRLWFSEEDEEGRSESVGRSRLNDAGWLLGQRPTGNWADRKRI